MTTAIITPTAMCILVGTRAQPCFPATLGLTPRSPKIMLSEPPKHFQSQYLAGFFSPWKGGSRGSGVAGVSP